MSLSAVDLKPNLGSELIVDKQTLLSGGDVAAEVRRLLGARGVLVVRGADFDDAEQLTFARTLGVVRTGKVRAEGEGGILKVTFDTEYQPAGSKYAFEGTFYWHMDGTHEEMPPWATILTPRILSPTGGQTEFASAHAAYEALPEAEKAQLATLQVMHSVATVHRIYNKDPDAETRAGWASLPTRVRPVVFTDKSGRKSLVIGASADHIVGMDRQESDALLGRLLEWMTQPQFVYQHQWRMGDMIIWDNMSMLHRVLPFDKSSGRRLHRVTLESEEAQAEAA